MKNQDYWNQFVKTGNIYDYLSYTACTQEDKCGYLLDDVKEGELEIGIGRSDRDGPVSNAYR